AHSEGLGQGARFTLRLPRESEPPALAAAAVRPGPGAAGRRVLVIEDNPDAAESLRLLFEAYGWHVAVASDGLEGVRAAEEINPDVIVCDVGLPGMDGYAVAQAVRGNEKTASARLIALTRYRPD